MNAGLLNPYHILLSSVKRDSGLLNNARVSQDIKYLERTFEDLSEKSIIYGFTKEIRRGPQNRIDDVLYTLTPSINFVGEMKKANKRLSDIQTKFPIRLPGHSGRDM